MDSEKHRTLAEVARALNAAHPALAGLPPLFFFTDEHRTPEPLHMIAGLPKGCGVVFRHYGVAARATLARAVLATCRAQDRVALVAGDANLAKDFGTDGIHLPAHMLCTLTELPFAQLITAAVHDEAEIRRAEALGVDAVFLSPVFPTASHPDGAALGIAKFVELVAATRLPVYALGGVSETTAPQLMGSGAVGIAAVEGLV